jgi:cytochrome c oxidase assembly factor CtaG
MADRVVPQLIVAALAGFGANTAEAHAATGGNDATAAFDVVLVVLLAASALLYARGAAALWARAGFGRGIRIGDATRFALGWLMLALALLSPIDALAERSFALHMVQHELLMVVAAPLLVLGRPLEAWSWAVPRSFGRVVSAAVRAAPLRQAFYALTVPLGAWIFHALALWIWHIPALFTAALESLPLHVLQHVCFFGSALGFWWAAFGGIARAASAASIASLFTTMLHTSALGALLTFAPRAWYVREGPAAFGLSPLEDQQLGGLVMWVPGSFTYMIAGLAIVAAWLSRSEPGVRS